MPAFKRFGPEDQLDNVLIVQPRYDLVSGTAGWRGSPNLSGALSLYGGARRRPGVFSSAEYESHAPNVGQTGNPRLGEPMTASVQFVYMTSEQRPFFQRSATRWGEEHWDVVGRLYDEYRVMDADYVTSSYDHYCLYFNRSSRNIAVSEFLDNGSNPILATGSFVLESWVKPFTTSSSPQTIQSMNRCFWFGVTGSNGVLGLSGSFGLVTSSLSLSLRRWNHVAAAYNSDTGSGSFYVNLRFAGAFASPSASLMGSDFAYYSIGGRLDNDNVSEIVQGFSAVTGVLGWSFDGFVGETRIWHGHRTFAQLSSSADSRLTGTALAGPVSCFQLREGPLGVVSSFAVGSGTVDFAGRARHRNGTHSTAELRGFSDRVGPVWHPNDNRAFFVDKHGSPQVLDCADAQDTLGPGSGQAWGPNAPDEIRRMLVVNVPSAFYGRQIAPGSVRMTCRAYEAFGLVRTLVDDGRGGLYLSGSACSSSLADREDYHGVDWNKVGNVFYGHGLITIKDPSLLDFGRDDGAFANRNDVFQLTFRGDSRIPVKTLMCRIDHGEFNCSSNPTFFSTGSAGERLRRHSSGSIRASTVGLYNSDRELVGVARLADPVRIKARNRINIKVRLDF